MKFERGGQDEEAGCGEGPAPKSPIRGGYDAHGTKFSTSDETLDATLSG